ncbi:MAG: TetR/AcrR family transcriptional regulator [Planctomycetota bacterium]
MGRPSLVAKRTTEILDAFERCVARFGIEGSSLDRIAEEARMQRSILRHYVGNREDLVRALAQRVIAKYEASFTTHLEDTGHLSPVEQLMTHLFPSKVVSTTQSLLVVEALIAASATSVDIREQMRGYVDGVIERSAGLLKREYPSASRQRCWAVAYGVVSICFNHESLSPIEPPPKYRRAAKEAARVLIQTLG